MKNTIKKTAIVLLLTFTTVILAGCGQSDREKLCDGIWESAVGYTQFTESGKILYNFESEKDSTSYYKLLSGKRINMYTEEGEQFGMVFDYRFEGDVLFIGEAEYRKVEE